MPRRHDLERYCQTALLSSNRGQAHATNRRFCASGAGRYNISYSQASAIGLAGHQSQA